MAVLVLAIVVFWITIRPGTGEKEGRTSMAPTPNSVELPMTALSTRDTVASMLIRMVLPNSAELLKIILLAIVTGIGGPVAPQKVQPIEITLPSPSAEFP